MEVRYFKNYSYNLNRDMEFKVYGHAGRPCLVFPAQSGRFYDFENFMQDIYKMDLIGFGKNVLLYYGITVVVYGVASYLICSLRYARAKKSLKCYYNNLKKLNSIYNE